MVGNYTAQASGPRRIVWVTYLHPEGFDHGIYSNPDTLIEHLRSGQDAVSWAAANRGARLNVIVIVVAYMPGLDYDPAAILKTLRDSCRTVPFVIAVRENGPLFRLSHHAFTAEFREICGYGTLVLDQDSSVVRKGSAKQKPGVAGKRGGLGIESRWDEILQEAITLMEGSVTIDSPASTKSADEAIRLVRAMREPGSRIRTGTFGRIHKRLMVALSLPGASMRSADIASVLGYAPRDIMNSYSAIAFVVRDEGDDPAHPDERGASDFCKRLGRDYQEWLISFGIRNRLVPQNYQ
jgi:hypothetical protein